MSDRADSTHGAGAEHVHVSKSRGSEYGRTISGSASGSSAGGDSPGEWRVRGGCVRRPPPPSSAASPSASAAGSPSSPSSAGGASRCVLGSGGACSASASGCSAVSRHLRSRRLGVGLLGAPRQPSAPSASRSALLGLRPQARRRRSRRPCVPRTSPRRAFSTNRRGPGSTRIGSPPS